MPVSGAGWASRAAQSRRQSQRWPLEGVGWVWALGVFFSAHRTPGTSLWASSRKVNTTVTDFFSSQWKPGAQRG